MGTGEVKGEKESVCRPDKESEESFFFFFFWAQYTTTIFEEFFAFFLTGIVFCNTILTKEKSKEGI